MQKKNKIRSKSISNLLIIDGHAHCDIPCKIYDPSTAQIAALTVIRMVDIIEEAIADEGSSEVTTINTINRAIAKKEEEAERVKHETRIIWGDYFKGALIEDAPDVHELAHSIMLTASATKQAVDRPTAEKLLKQVNQFAELFWRSKGIDVKTATCPYPPSEPTVYPIIEG
tara:strand:+ start:386 stop:898 length:513 start_codon:yes stop_codon:yes gene_type:complete